MAAIPEGTKKEPGFWSPSPMDIISLLGMATAVALSYGSLNAQVDTLRIQVDRVEERIGTTTDKMAQLPVLAERVQQESVRAGEFRAESRQALQEIADEQKRQRELLQQIRNR